jgi:hypothetical protein
VKASRTQLHEGADSTITFSTNFADHPDLTVIYSTVDGNPTATFGIDYTLSGPPNMVVIPANQSSASIGLHAFQDSMRERNGETAVITVEDGGGYIVPANKGARRVVILILDPKR